MRYFQYLLLVLLPILAFANLYCWLEPQGLIALAYSGNLAGINLIVCISLFARVVFKLDTWEH